MSSGFQCLPLDNDTVKRADAESIAVGASELLNASLYELFPGSADLPDEPMSLTLNSVLIGWSMGALVNGSNAYLS